MAANETPQLAIVMPAYNAAGLLPTTLPPLIASQPDGGVWVVDPGSSDGTARIAEQLGANVIQLPSREGPAVARNAGVNAADAEIVLFVDADCLAPEDLPSRVAACFRASPDMVALTGSYDDAPAHRGVVSLYMNLRHHHTHQNAARTNATFWAGMGAVRREAFLKVSGFDGTRYPRPMIEDIELGLRLGKVGATCLDPALQVKHLKHWTLSGMIRTDIQCRAIPWTRLIQETGQIPNDLNLRWSARVSALLSPLALLGALTLPLFPMLGSSAFFGLVPIALSVYFCWGLLKLIGRVGGGLAAVGGWALHQLHLFYSATVFVLCTVIGRKEAAQ